MKVWSAAWIWMLLPVGGLLGQGESATPPAYGERVEVEVVNVDVIATDREGNFVRDLVEGDFILEVDGRAVPIEYFSAPRAVAEAASSPETSPVAGAAEVVPSNLLVFVDQSALEVQASTLVLEQLREFVTARALAGDRVLIAAFADSLRILAPGTSDAEAVEAALDELDKIRGRGTRISAERGQIEREIRMLGQGRTTPGSLSGPVDAGELNASIRRLADEEVDRQRRLVEALTYWITTFSGMDGRKSLLLATPGFTANPAAYLSELADSVARTIDPTNRARAGSLQSIDLNLYQDFERLLLRAQDARIAVYTLAPRPAPPGSNSAQFGSVGPGSTAPPPRDQAEIEEASSLSRLADATGGRNFAIDKSLGERLDTVTDDSAAAYSLGITTGPEAGTKPHSIHVRIRRDGVELRHREAFRRDTLDERVEEALAAAAAFGLTDLSFEVTLETGAIAPSPRQKKGKVLPLAVRIPISAIVLAPQKKKRSGGAPAGNYEGHLTVRFAVSDAKGALHLGEATPVLISIPAADLERARGSAWVHRGELDLTPGEQRVAVIVVDQASGFFATRSVAVDVPAK